MSTEGGRKETLKLHHNTLAMLDWHRAQLKSAAGQEIDREEMIMYLCKARHMALTAKVEKEIADEESAVNKEQTND